MKITKCRVSQLINGTPVLAWIATILFQISLPTWIVTAAIIGGLNLLLCYFGSKIFKAEDGCCLEKCADKKNNK